MYYWYQLDISQVLQHLGSNADSGLSDNESRRRLQHYGTNELVERSPKHSWQIFLEQFQATTVLVLIAAAIVSLILGDNKDAMAIMAIVIFNALLGFTQEYRASKAFAALKKLAVPKVRVCREGKWQEILARQLVPGDIIKLEAGDIVPADCRVVDSIDLWVQEAALTGESEPVEKTKKAIAGEDLSLADRHNMLYLGTVTTKGRGRAVVTETGMNTELGKVACLMQTVEREPTPLMRRQEQLGRRLAAIALSLAAVIFVLGTLRGETFQLMIMTAVSMAVAIIPEGLPAIITITLALGARRMLKRQALIRKLPAVETLGSVTVICSDKTGTLTQNRMTATVIEVAGQRIELKCTNQNIPNISEELQKSEYLSPAIALILSGGTLCNDAILPSGKESALGDPTEVALVVAAESFGLNKIDLEQEFPRVAEVPFDSDRKCMTTIHKVESGFDKKQSKIQNLKSNISTPYIAFTKGAVGALLEISKQVWTFDRIEPLDATWRKQIIDSTNQLAQTGTRVLGIAFRLLDNLPESCCVEATEQDLVFIGIVGMLDPARPEVSKAVQICQQAGIRPVMITGDHPLTAQHIAQELGICAEKPILTGQELNQLSPSTLEEKVGSISVYARVSPQQKLKIVSALQQQGHIVAMTGDGVNDAPALKKADIGVAMGITGTDVAKEAADMVLLDDNFATIVAAVKEGRVIYDNIRKFIRYTLTGNASGVWIMVLSPLMAMPLPLQPLQILWINLLADGLLAVALSVEPAERDVMHRLPYSPNESVFRRGVRRDIMWMGWLTGLAIAIMGYTYWSANLANWQTMIFVTLAFSRISLALAMRSERDSLFRIGLLSNKPMLEAVALTFVLQLGAIYLPWLQAFFHTTPLAPQDLGLSLIISTVGFWGVEIEKLILRRNFYP